MSERALTERKGSSPCLEQGELKRYDLPHVSTWGMLKRAIALELPSNSPPGKHQAGWCPPISYHGGLHEQNLRPETADLRSS